MKNLAALVVAPLLLAASWAQAGSVQLTVLNAEGRFAPDTVVLIQPTATWAPQALPPTTVIEQKETRFVPYVTVVPVGAAVRFVNNDSFDHHVRSQPGGPLGSIAPVKEFEYRLPPQRKGNNASPDMRLDVAGSVVLGCHLHNSMRGHLYVSTTPWYGVTDDQGKVRIDGVPDGQVEVRIWHPDQLTEQPNLRLQVQGNASAETKLNFTPRRRPAPRVAPRGEYG